MRSKSDLRPGQIKLVTELFERDEGIAVLEPGGGKTAAALTAFEELLEEGVIDRALVLAPPRVAATVWPNEPLKWKHLEHLPVIGATGTPAQRKVARAAWGHGTILAASLDNAKTIAKELSGEDLSRTMLIIDEISKLKAPTGPLAKAVEEFAARFAMVYGLTGSPRPNGWQDLFRPVRIVTRGRVWGDKSFDDWRRDHFRPDAGGFVWTVHTFAEPLLEEAVKPVVFSVPPEHYDGLPPLHEGRDFDIEVELPDHARALYTKMERDALVKIVRDLGDNEEGIVVALSQGVVSGKLAQLAQGYLYDEGLAQATAHDAKRDALADLLDQFGREPTIICHGYRQDEATIRALCGKNTPILGGATTGAQANRAIAGFSRGEIERLGLHPASAGHGVDGLQEGGRYMVWLCPTWSQELYQQTLRRLWRPGQTRPVYSYRIIAKDTVDELKRARVEGKAAQEAAFKAMIARVGL